MNGRLSSPFHGPGPSRTLTTTSDGLGGDGI
jgi:hypothetical protein